MEARERRRNDGSNVINAVETGDLRRPDMPSDVLPLPRGLSQRRFEIRRRNLMLAASLPTVAFLALHHRLQAEPVLRCSRRGREGKPPLEVLLSLTTCVLRQDGFHPGLHDGSDLERSLLAVPAYAGTETAGEEGALDEGGENGGEVELDLEGEIRT